MLKQDLKKVFENFNNLNILIIGDVMIDSYLWGKAERISPEAPVPIVAVKARQQRLGGAANVALNVQALGAKAILCSVVGNDTKGCEFQDILKENNLTSVGIVTSNDRITTTKFRIIAGNHQMLRVDEETDTPLNVNETFLFLKRIEEIIQNQNIDAVIFEDYDKGVITEEVIQRTIALTKRRNIPTVVDPKHRNFEFYKNVTLFKPNLKELKEGLKLTDFEANIESLNRASGKLFAKLNNDITLVTLSELGVFIANNKTKESKLIPAHIRNIADVSGAGDTVISVVALLLASKVDEFTTASVSNLAGGLVCEHVGVVSIDKNKLLCEAEKQF